jgi:hypothetical protein
MLPNISCWKNSVDSNWNLNEVVNQKRKKQLKLKRGCKSKEKFFGKKIQHRKYVRIFSSVQSMVCL